MKSISAFLLILSLILFLSCAQKDIHQACVEKPNPDCFCTEQWDPVCGCNQKTYSNACHAQCAGILQFESGECP
ncbi:MAG: Kazal-type serine protease inhibitor domain-containing protein [Bacteroidota bacterium]